MSEEFLAKLRRVNGARAAAWVATGDGDVDGLFWATELGGEVGEALNVVKKLHREDRGWRGSRASAVDLGKELADVIICVDNLARYYRIDLQAAVIEKFDETSEKHGFPQRLNEPDLLCTYCGRWRSSAESVGSTHCNPPFTVQPHLFDGHHPAHQKHTLDINT